MFARLIQFGASGVVVLGLAGGMAYAAESVVALGASPADHGSTPATPIDESALRYYASLKQTSRVQAETRRLKRINPQWQPPADLWATRPGSSNEESLWELYALEKFDELRAAIAARRARDPSWAPSTDLAQKMMRKQNRAKVVAGKLAGRWDDVASAADEGRLDEEIGDVALLWDIADAYARMKRSGDALRVLTSILAARSDPNERVATIQKAIACLPMADAERLIAVGRKDAAGISEFATIEIDITRARIGAFLHSEPANDVSAAEMARFMDYARAESDANQPGLVAWHGLKRGDLREALEWFKVAIAKGGDATVAHGLALALLRLGQLRETEEVAYAWREPSTANAILFIDVLADQLTQPVPIQIEPKRLARYAAVTMQTASGEGAQALAWYAYNSCQFDVAAEWFRRAVAWFPKEATAFGYALTLQRLKRHQEFVEVVNRYDGLFPKVLTLLFPEKQQPTGPCDTTATVKPAPASGKPSEFLDLRTAQSAVATGRGAKAAIPKPLAASIDVVEEVPLVKRADFPVVVSPENPLRYQPTNRSAVRAAVTVDWRERTTIADGTVARRVQGIGPMPYERFGITLRKGWQGLDQPSLVSPDTQVPSGTLWHSERAAAKAADSSTTSASPLKANATALSDSSASAASRFHP